MKYQNIKLEAPEDKNPNILGTFEGECLEIDVINNNGWDMSEELWNNVLDSEEYKTAIEHGWYIGFLGHPEDPNCMDFEHACIVLKRLELKNNGKLYGKFDLINTPVGRIVKCFNDAGVKFGISVRGVGDIIQQSVEPEGFIFRGFDLVTFPAFPSSIPTFTAIAASTDIESRKKYKAVKKSIAENISSITSATALDVIKSQFSKKSDEYKEIVEQESKLAKSTEADDVAAMKLEAMTKLYVDSVTACKQLAAQLDMAKKQNKAIKASYDKKLKAIKRIFASQISDIQAEGVLAAKELKTSLAQVDELNLKYKQEVKASQSIIAKDKQTISTLRAKLDETVTEDANREQKVSNLDNKVKRLQQSLTASQKLVEEYQEAYARLYGKAVGSKLTDISITATTTVKQLQALLGGTNTANIAAKPAYEIEVIEDDVDEVVDDELVIM